MNWFSKKKIKSEVSQIKLDKSFENLKQLNHQQGEEILRLEKESVYWKEKAMNFRKFHQ